VSGSRDRIRYLRALLITAPLIVIYTAIMGSISVVSSLVDSTGRMQHGCARIWSRLILWTSGVRITVKGLGNIKPGVPCVFCVNHQSHMDIPIVLVALPVQFRFLAKKQLFSIPFLGWHLRRSGQISIDRENPRAALKSMRAASAEVQKGTPVVIFPEGGTSVDGVMHPFKGGGFVLATHAKIDVVPVTIRGSRQVLVPKTYQVRSGNVEVTIDPPISSRDLSASELAARTYETMLRTFNARPNST
jgi:1-acyl-sn-glycerol-3-phosphate acyltransferase